MYKPHIFVPKDWRLVLAQIDYWMPDYTHVLQGFIWRDIDEWPHCPALKKFLDFWEANLEGRLHRVTRAACKIGDDAHIRSASLELRLH